MHIKDSFIFPTIHSFNKYLLSNYYILDNVLGSGNLVVNKTNIPALMEETGNKQARKKVQKVLKYYKRKVQGEVIKDNGRLVDINLLRSVRKGIIERR